MMGVRFVVDLGEQRMIDEEEGGDLEGRARQEERQKCD